EVYFVEPIKNEVLERQRVLFEKSESTNYFRQVMKSFELENCSALLLAGTPQTVGLPYAKLREIAGRADILINISGMLKDETLVSHIPTRVFLDLDPAFNQLWHVVEGIDMGFDRHTHFVTVGLALGESDCTIPTCGLPWIKTLQPVVLSEWPVAEQITYNALTTIANWRGYGSIEYDGKFYGQKAHSLRQFMTLPKQTDENFLLALAIHPDEKKDLKALHDNDWQLSDPQQVAATPESYQRFIQGSKAEFGIAKSGYVISRSGWFSDRSACYLASSRPVIAQNTGFSRFLPTGEGLFAFNTMEEVLTGLEHLKRDYARQARTARALAEEYFDANRVLKKLLEKI
ncbi:MAG: glycosyltransferase, partial [bacterium]